MAKTLYDKIMHQAESVLHAQVRAVHAAGIDGRAAKKYTQMYLKDEISFDEMLSRLEGEVNQVISDAMSRQGDETRGPPGTLLSTAHRTCLPRTAARSSVGRARLSCHRGGGVVVPHALPRDHSAVASPDGNAHPRTMQDTQEAGWGGDDPPPQPAV